MNSVLIDLSIHKLRKMQQTFWLSNVDQINVNKLTDFQTGFPTEEKKSVQ